MSSPQLPAAVAIEPSVAAVEAELTPAAPVEASAPANQAAEAPAAAADLPAAIVADTEASIPTVAESPAAEEQIVAEATKSEEKKDKKHGRKPFAELFNKILKPHPQDKSTPEKKAEPEVTEDPVAVAPEVAAPVVEVPAVEPEVTAAVTETADGADVAASVQPEDAAKEVTTPRKERGNIFEKFTAFVMKPKSPKGKKTDAPKEDAEEVKPEAPTAAEIAIAPEAQAAEEVAPASPQLSAPEVTEATAADAVVSTETPEEAKIEKKEKTPKDLAKLARRFSGRLFGVDKKKEASKKPEPTPEEAAAASQTEVSADAAVVPDSAAPTPEDTTPEVAQSAVEPTPVIAATA